MGRKPRDFQTGKCYHITHRSNARRQIFHTDYDKAKYLEYLSRAAKKQSCKIHAVSIMSNHVHLLVSQNMDGSISRLIMHAHGAYGRYLNSSLRVEGKVWGHRFRTSESMDEEYQLSCMAYIDLNSVRAGLCNTPRQWKWSSHQLLAFGTADINTFQSLITPLPFYTRLKTSHRGRQREYRRLVSKVQSHYLEQQESLIFDKLRL